MHLEVSNVKVHYLDENKIIESQITISDKLWILNEIEKMKKSIVDEIILDPTPNQDKCTDCEYLIYCQKI